MAIVSRQSSVVKLIFYFSQDLNADQATAKIQHVYREGYIEDSMGWKEFSCFIESIKGLDPEDQHTSID